MSGTEPFPSIDEGTTPVPVQGQTLGSSLNGEKKVQRRRKSSGLGGEIRAGDTGGPALSTMEMRTQGPGLLRAKSERDRKAKPFSKRRKVRSILRRTKNYCLKNTWAIPLALLVLFGISYGINPTESNPIYPFVHLSYPVEQPGAPADAPQKYSKGRNDFKFVAFYTIFLSFTREFIMQRILRPLSIRAGLKSRAKQSRFMEQMYTAIYFGFSGPAGLWVMSHTPIWYFNINGMYEGYPHKVLDWDFKFYYLFQAAYWAQQAIVLLLGMEKPRKDFKELVLHHIVSLSLIWASYRFHFTHMGLPVYITHDISDFFLATSKTLNYIDHPFVGPYFGLFIIVWIYLRHYLNLRILLSEFYEFKTIGPYELIWDIEQYKSPLAHYISTCLLAALQGLNLFWLFAILRIAYRFLFQNELEDDRSEYEDDEQFEKEKKVEQEVKKEEEQEAMRIKMAAEAPTITLNGDAVETIPEVKHADVPVEPVEPVAKPVRRSQRRKA